MRLAIGVACGLLLMYIGKGAGATASWWPVASGLIGGSLGGALYDAYLRDVL